MKKDLLIVVVVFLGLSVVGVGALFVGGLIDLGFQKFFKPRQENIQREVFEQTQSYVHGKIQDLAKYHDEYQRADTQEEKEAIRTIILMRFAEFDAEKIQSAPLKNFLIRTRGY